VSGYVLGPNEYNARKLHPVVFGYETVKTAGDTVVCLDLKIFGGAVNGTELSSILRQATGAQTLEIVEESKVTTDNLRRVMKKVLKRSKSSAAFQRHLQLLHEGGAVNVQIEISLDCTEYAFQRADRMFRVKESIKGNINASMDISLGICDKEYDDALLLVKFLRDGFVSGSFAKLIGDKGSFALNHPCSIKTKSRTLRIPNDTPRLRKSRARELTFSVAERLTTPNFNAPRFEAGKYVHPVHFNRKTVHVRPSVEKVSPVFWGDWYCPQIKDYKTDLNHPAYIYSESNWVERNALMHKTPTHIQEDSSKVSPMFFGRVLCPPEYNSLDIQPVIEDDEEEDVVIPHPSCKVLKRYHVHPATLGYKEIKTPIFQTDLCKVLHPASFGYQDIQHSPKSVIHILHPACVGFKMASKEFNMVKDASKYVNPMFFGLSLEKGPRFSEQDDSFFSHMKKRVVAIPRRDGKPICSVCFGSDAPGCPGCWKEELQSRLAVEATCRSLVDNLAASHTIAPRVAGKARPSAQLRLRNKAVQKQFKLFTQQITTGDIKRYREMVSVMVTVMIKSLPAGGVVKLTMEISKSISYLYFLYRSNCRSGIANLTKLWLVLPSMEGLMCLDDTLQAQSDLLCAVPNGALCLRDFGMVENGGTYCLFQLKDLHRPSAADVCKTYVAQNVNLAKKHSFDQFDDVQMQRQYHRYLGANNSSVSIKTRSSQMRESKSNHEPVLNKDIFNSVDFTNLMFKPSQVLPGLLSDKLQKVLVMEMKDILIRQQDAWVEETKTRKRRNSEQREETNVCIKRKEGIKKAAANAVVPSLKLPQC